MIIALAGRRIDAPDAERARFPLANTTLVSERLRRLFHDSAATALVSSAACGADLIALSVAGSLGMRRRIVLPFDAQRFRKQSVNDRPGDWGRLYDEILEEVRTKKDLVVLDYHGLPDAAYAAANGVILNEAASLSLDLHEVVRPVLVWEGEPRGRDDLTQAFGQEAERRGLRVVEVLTR
jgi:hypothetical protein